MITGIGLDIIEIERVAKINERGDAFRKKVLTAKECAIYDTLKPARQLEFLAGRFSAKEAFSKALGTGLGKDCALHDIEILKAPNGQPLLYFKGEKVPGFVSITHSKAYAAAQVILEKA